MDRGCRGRRRAFEDADADADGAGFAAALGAATSGGLIVAVGTVAASAVAATSLPPFFFLPAAAATRTGPETISITILPRVQTRDYARGIVAAPGPEFAQSQSGGRRM